MKSGLLIGWCFRMLVAGSLLPVFAQGQEGLVSNTADAGGFAREDRQISSNVPLNEIRSQAFRQFNKHFPTVGEQHWYKTEDGYIVNFTDQGMRNQAHFSSKGSFLYSLKFYEGKDMGAELRGLIGRRFPGYRVNVVTEFSDGVKTGYFVRIENETSAKGLNISNGNIEVFDDLVNGGLFHCPSL